VSGLGPTDLKIRRGNLAAVYPLPARAVLGFETAGVVDAVGDGVTGIAVGDEVAAQLMTLCGYGEFVVAKIWALTKDDQLRFLDGRRLIIRSRSAAAVASAAVLSFLAAGCGGSKAPSVASLEPTTAPRRRRAARVRRRRYGAVRRPPRRR